MTTNNMPEVNIDRANSRIRRLTDQLATSERLLQELRDKVDKVLEFEPHDAYCATQDWDYQDHIGETTDDPNRPCDCWKAGL